MKKIKLFCLPYAGGSSSIYSRWNKRLGDIIEVQSIELSGRGRRYNDPLYDSVGQTVDDIYRMIEPDIATAPDYAIFGHSLGGLLAYELIHKIKSERKPCPIHAFFSGSKAPNVWVKDEKTYDLPDQEFKQKVFEMGGTPREILESQELLELFLPILRADFKINETYEYAEKTERIDCGITVISGKKEDVKLHELTEWRKHTEGECKFFVLDGDHFFINTHTDDVLKIVSSILTGA